MKQYYINPDYYEKEFERLFQELNVDSILLVCGKSFFSSIFSDFFNNLYMNMGIKVTYFFDFSSNPKYEDIIKGLHIFRRDNCDIIVAVGGGSAIDVAKCIKLFSNMKNDIDYVNQVIIANNISLIAVPTTAGTGSEATQFAVIYVKGEKYSIDHESALPKYILLHPASLKTLPEYQKKVTICDALSHAVESYWSINSTIESRKLAERAIQIILDNLDGYLDSKDACYINMLWAANYAGQAINITRTTAAHAMCYKLTTLLNIPHGYAVMLCLPEVWEYMQDHLDMCVDVRGKQYLQETLENLAHCLQQDTSAMAIIFLKQLRTRFGFGIFKELNQQLIAQLVDSVNIDRLTNFPIALFKQDLMNIYYNILLEER